MNPAIGRRRGPVAVPPSTRNTGRIIVMPKANAPEPPPSPAQAVRRPSPQQGQALELLGHAIEYLVDENLHRGRGEAYDSDAVQILISLNRAIFSECQVVVPFGNRLKSWINSRLAA